MPTAPGFRSIQWAPNHAVGMTVSPDTGSQQVISRQGQWLECTVTLPAMTDATAGEWCAFFLSLNSREGTFYLGDSVRKTRLGAVTGTLTVSTGAVANTTTLPIAGATGSFALGDWLQVGTGSSSRLHRVIKVVSSSSVDVFPRLRTAYANGTAIDVTSPQGLFRLQGPVPWGYDERKIAEGITFAAVEVVP